MAVPALVFVLANRGGATRGWGIPTATDIAFSIGVLTLLKDRVPRGLIVFVTALAIFDDIGGILVIAFFYGHGLQVAWLGAAAVLAAVCFLLGRARVRSLLAWTVVGGALAVALHQGGIHSTIAGVIAGLAVPARCRDVHAEPPLDRFVRLLHPWVAYGIVPLFALANAGVSIGAVGMRGFAAPVTLGAALGLFAGKQAGIFGATMIAVRAGVAPMPGDATPAQLWGASVVAGIGLTVALFIAALAFGHDAQLLDEARLGILLGSLASGLAGYAVLRAVGTPVAPGEALDAGE